MALIESNDALIEQHLKENELTVVKYYADWCGSCKLFAPKYKRLSNDVRFEGIQFLDINAETNPESRKKGAVNNLPSFAIFKQGILAETLNTSKEEALVEMLEKLKN